VVAVAAVVVAVAVDHRICELIKDFFVWSR